MLSLHFNNIQTMDTIKTLALDATAEVFTESPQKEANEVEPLNVFVMGVIGVFTFVFFYIVLTKIATVVIKKMKINKTDKYEHEHEYEYE